VTTVVAQPTRVALFLLAVVAGLAVCWLALRLGANWRTRRALAHRTRLLLVPTTSFDASADSLDRVAQLWARAARRVVGGWATRRAGAVRILLGQDAHTGKMAYLVEAPEWAAESMTLPPFGEVQVRPESDVELRGDPRAAAARASRWWLRWL
jgi:hypothetical protein